MLSILILLPSAPVAHLPCRKKGHPLELALQQVAIIAAVGAQEMRVCKRCGARPRWQARAYVGIAWPREEIEMQRETHTKSERETTSLLIPLSEVCL
mmetsp:Transcript_5999/g.8936  ORF Transcript_5999/g.8936 Transcript_5999/m.8936 type:complete len:97 (+) Transcript_5999:787-1077(+)